MPTIPHFSFLFCLSSLLIYSTNAHTQCLDHQKTLLLQLKNELIIDSIYTERKLAGWNQTDDCCSWDGVVCDGAGHVTGLHLNSEAISGGLDDKSSSLFSLTHLEKLNLADNNFNFTQIPRGIANLTHLTHLDLSNSYFGGQLPVEQLSLLTRLISLDISGNWAIEPLNENFNLTMLLHNLTGLTELYLDQIDMSVQGSEWAQVISSSLPQLKILSLAGCGLSSPLHQSFLQLHSLRVLKLDLNNLSTLSPDLLVSFSSLTNLSLADCSLTGSLSSMLFEALHDLVDIDLARNSLTGTIPDSLFRLSSLEVLKLNNNQLNGTFELGNIQWLPKLSVLELSYNNLFVESSISNSSLSTFPQLSILGLVSCNLHSFPDLRNQSNINFLDMSNNSITGEIPNWIWEVGNEGFYYLNLSCNLMLDLQTPYHVPTSLRVLDLHSNLLEGDFPMQFPPSTTSFLVFFSIAHNSLRGPIPNSFCNHTRLDVLDLSFNYLSGNIPSCLLENTDSLPVLNLRRNNISGDIPDTFPVNCRLETLDLSDNNLGGTVPKSLSNCKNLMALNVGNNNINDSFPCMQLSSSLRLLVLRSNRFHGELRCHRSLPNLQIIDISSNSFSGYLNPINFSSWRGMMSDSDVQLMRNELNFIINQLSYYQYEVALTIKGQEREVVKIWGDFASIDFSCNNFQGAIPDAIGGLGSLDHLNLSHNALTGAIPKTFGKLGDLGSLDLSVNQLTGTIPVELAGLTFLGSLNLSYNKFVGMIPIGPQVQTFSADSFQGNTGLCGLPLNISCSNSDENGSSPPKSENVDPHGKMEVEWDYASAALGYVVGVGSFVWTFLCCHSLKTVYFEKIDEVLDMIFKQGNRNGRQGGRGRRRRRIPLNHQVRRQ